MTKNIHIKLYRNNCIELLTQKKEKKKMTTLKRFMDKIYYQKTMKAFRKAQDQLDEL